MRNTATYTFILEFRGGTYCSQVKAGDIEKAIDKWTDKITKDRHQIKFLTLHKLDKLKREIKGGARPSKLKGLKNIWFTLLLTTKDRMYINIIKTDTTASR